MPDLPYTDEDLRAEAARQHADLTEDPDFMGVGEGMEDRYVQSTVIDEDPDFEREGRTWAELLDPEQDGTDVYDEAQRKIHDLISKAADVSEWAVNLGADGLAPSTDHAISLAAGDRPIVRIHFAFDPGMPEEMRTSLVEGVGDAIAGAL